MKIAIISLVFFILLYVYHHFLSGLIIYLKIHNKTNQLIEKNIFLPLPFTLPNRYPSTKPLDKKTKIYSKVLYYLTVFMYLLWALVSCSFLLIAVFFTQRYIIYYLLGIYTFVLIIVIMSIRVEDIEKLYVYSPLPAAVESEGSIFLYVRLKNKFLERMVFRWTKFIPTLATAIIIAIILFLK